MPALRNVPRMPFTWKKRGEIFLSPWTWPDVTGWPAGDVKNPARKKFFCKKNCILPKVSNDRK
jgi:hypothetical protein